MDFITIIKGIRIKRMPFIIWLETESNRRHKDFQSFALPTELSSLNKNLIIIQLFVPLLELIAYGPVGPRRSWSFSKKKTLLYRLSYRANNKICMEEEEGFEPPRALTPLSVFKTDPFSQTWVFLQDEKWTLQDSNLRPIGYEPIALTN